MPTPSESGPGPTDPAQGQTPPARRDDHVRASTAEREAVVARLSDAVGEGRLTLDEFTERTDQVYAARTRGELDHVLHDLPAPRAGQDLAPAEIARAPIPVGESKVKAKTRWIIAVMSGSQRRGRWRVERRNRVLMLMGGADLDLRGAELADTEVSIQVVAVMGGGTIIVPPGINVDVGEFAFMGGNGVDQRLAEHHPGAPTVRIRITAIMGGVDVKTKEAGA